MALKLAAQQGMRAQYRPSRWQNGEEALVKETNLVRRFTSQKHGLDRKDRMVRCRVVEIDQIGQLSTRNQGKR